MQTRKKSGQQSIKEANLKLVFSLICKEESLSRADIKKITKLSAATVSSLVEELLELGLIIEVGTKEVSTSGRKAILLNVNPEGGYLAGVEISSAAIMLDLYNLRFEKVLHKEKSLTGKEAVLDSLADFLKKEASAYKILGVAVGVPAIINSADNSVVSSTVVDIEKGVNLVKFLKADFPGAEIDLCNTSGLIAYAEKEFGAGVGVLNLVSIEIADGVGAGVVIEGDIYGGTNGIACEFGHVSVDYKGPRCKCGNFGCLEMFVSLPAIMSEAEKRLGKKLSGTSELQSLLDNENSDVKAVIDEAARALAFGINNLVNIIDPEVVVLYGKVCRLGEHLLAPLLKYRDALALSANTTEIKYSLLGDDAVTMGGAKYAFDKFFTRKKIF